MSLLKSADGQPRGPNLLARTAPATAPAEGHRILSQLEHGAAVPATSATARWHPGWWRWAGGAICLAALGVAVLSYEPASAPLAQAVPVPAVARKTTAVPEAPPKQPDAAQHAATIVNDAAPPVPAPVVALPAPAAAQAPRKAPPVRQAATRAPASRAVAAAPGDSDVALLTAMVAHAQRQDGTPARDVVLRRDDEETASLLQRCKQLGMIEGMLCRSRICSGRWDSDPACH